GPPLATRGPSAAAGRMADEGRAIGAEDDLITQIYWRVARAHVSAARGDAETARALATEVVELATDYDSFDGPYALGEVAPHLPPDEGRRGLENALAGASTKGNLITEAAAREALEGLPSPSR